MKIRTIKTGIFLPRGDLFSFLEKHLPRLTEKTILVVTSKIVALSEGRCLKAINEKIKKEIIAQESELVLPTKYVCLTIKDGLAMANAGVDESNANGGLILLPRDSFRAADKIRNHFRKEYRLKDFGVIITDSRCLPLRAGITGVALGYAGFRGLKDYRKSKDIFGRPFHYSRVDVADSLAAAAVLNMGEGNERKPIALITDAPVEYVEKIDKNELKINIREDIYGPLFRKIK